MPCEAKCAIIIKGNCSAYSHLLWYCVHQNAHTYALVNGSGLGYAPVC